MVVIGIDPEIRPAQSEFLRRAVDTDVETDMRGGTFHFFHLYPRQCSILQKVTECIEDAGTADDRRRLQFITVSQLHPDGAIPVSQDFFNLRIHKNLASCSLDDGCDGPGDTARAAHRIVGTIQIMIDNSGVNSKRTLPRRQAVITVLPGKDADQLSV